MADERSSDDGRDPGWVACALQTRRAGLILPPSSRCREEYESRERPEVNMRSAPQLPTWFASLIVVSPIVGPPALAQTPTPDAQVAAATLPLPEEMRAGARVIGWNESGEQADLREGTNGMICIADELGDDRFRVVCYPEALHSLLSRNRELRRENLEEAERDRRLEEEVKAGSIVLPEQPAALHVIDGPTGSYDPATGQLSDEASRLRIIFTPYGTAEEMGLPTERQGDMPWVMNSGELFSHIMIFEGNEERE